MKRTYEKPSMKNVSLFSSKKIALVCWGNHDKYGPDNMYWYDNNGSEPGFYRFAMIGSEGTGCDINSIVVSWFASRADLAAGIYTPQPSGSAGYELVKNHILSECKNPKGNENYMANNPGGIEDDIPEDFS